MNIDLQQPELTQEQKKLMEELTKRPEVLQLLQVIFGEYPKYIITEVRQSNPNSSKRQKMKGFETTEKRLQIERWIEKEVCKLVGIKVDVDSKINKEKINGKE
jgi:hypothetical protein